MRNTLLTISLVSAAITTLIISCDNVASKAPAGVSFSKDSLLKRGEYLVTIGVCDDCHSPKKMGPQGPEVDTSLRLSGFPGTRPLPKYDSNVIKKGQVIFNEDFTSAGGPWGASFSANLTSDDTGIGNWSEEHFFRAIREGKFKGISESRSLLPPMPWTNFRMMSDEDLRAIFTFLKSTKPVKNIVPGPRQLAEL